MSKVLIYIPTKLSKGGQRQLEEVCGLLASAFDYVSLALPKGYELPAASVSRVVELSGLRFVDELKLP